MGAKASLEDQSAITGTSIVEQRTPHGPAPLLPHAWGEPRKMPYRALDAVWRSSKIDMDDATARLLRTVARRRIFRPKVLYMGPKQGPGIFQAFMDSSFAKLRGPGCEDLLAIFMDDVFIFTPAAEGDTDDDIVDKHILYVEVFFKKAAVRNAKFRLTECSWCQINFSILGFTIENEARAIDHKKPKAVQKWPEPQRIHDICELCAIISIGMSGPVSAPSPTGEEGREVQLLQPTH